MERQGAGASDEEGVEGGQEEVGRAAEAEDGEKQHEEEPRGGRGREAAEQGERVGRNHRREIRTCLGCRRPPPLQKTKSSSRR